MQRTQTQKGAAVVAPAVKSAPYRMGGYRRPVYRSDTRFVLTESGRAQADAYAQRPNK